MTHSQSHNCSPECNHLVNAKIKLYPACLPSHFISTANGNCIVLQGKKKKKRPHHAVTKEVPFTKRKDQYFQQFHPKEVIDANELTNAASHSSNSNKNMEAKFPTEIQRVN